jgi:hypothetical protein
MNSTFNPTAKVLPEPTEEKLAVVAAAIKPIIYIYRDIYEKNLLNTGGNLFVDAACVCTIH